MSTGATIVIIVAAVVVLALLGWFAWMQMRRRQLQEQFGPEYDKALEEGKDRREVERDLAERRKRHDQLDIRPLDAAARDRYSMQWERIQAQFVDDPGGAVTEADRLVTVVMRERGYPTEGYEQQLADLSVRHAAAVGHYRSAHDLTSRSERGRVSTEELREAMTHYRAMFEDLVTDVDDRAGRREHATRSENGRGDAVAHGGSGDGRRAQPTD
ncbi:MAG TPA: hypothetical protein VGX25_14280 [Actinophytocola sp.]|uniref:hypothetical protein n=1 Tax=Actinophytocola sp. TaxID=1872138 RepID=UPI002DDD7ADE|nr:hypothetical protein [Actinophytocola sp.]HEV2780554.1 hypothetical protein [Actinophytocola sp.]